jgi:ribosome-associated protein
MSGKLPATPAPASPPPDARGGALAELGPQQPPGTLGPGQLVAEIASLAADKKAQSILEIDLRDLVSYADYLVLATGNTERQTKAIHDAIDQGLRHAHGIRPRRVEGLVERQWILMDYLDVVVHVFTPATREFYRLESLWGEAPARAIADPSDPSVALAELAGA